MSKPWEELHTPIATEQEFKDSCNFKGLTCERPAPSICPWVASRVAGAPVGKSCNYKGFTCERPAPDLQQAPSPPTDRNAAQPTPPGWRVEGGGWRVEGGGWGVEGGGWRVEGGGWRVEGGGLRVEG